MYNNIPEIYKNIEVYNGESTEYQACKLFALTNGALTWSMLVIPYKKQNKIK